MTGRNFYSWMPTFYAWIPAVLVVAVVILALPWLAVIALLVLVLAVAAGLGFLAWSFVAALKALGHSVLGRSHGHSTVSRGVVLDSPGVGSSGMAFAPDYATSASPSRPLLSSTPDQSEVLAVAGINPIDAYEHPYMAVAWRTPGLRTVRAADDDRFAQPQ